MIDLRFNYPILDFQHKLLQETLATLAVNGEFLDMIPLKGFSIDRQVGAQWLSRPHYAIEPVALLIASSGHNALTAICLATNLAGQTVIVDPLTYNGFIGLASMLSITLIACPTDEWGMLPNALEGLCRNPTVKAIYVTPTIHNPLAYTMPLTRRNELVSIARKADVFIVDDDAYGFLDPQAPVSFAHLAPERGFFIYSFSKPVAPGIKTAFIVTPPPWQSALATTLRATGSSSGTLFARVITNWITTGVMDRLIRAKRQQAMEKQVMVDQIFRGFTYTTQPTSYHVWFPLHESVSSQHVGEWLLSKGVDVATGDAYRVGKSFNQDGIRVALGNVDDQSVLLKGLKIVAEHLRQ